MKKIFIINGQARSGKTSFGEMVGEILKEQRIPFEHNSSITPVKIFLSSHGWLGRKWDKKTKDDYWRKAMYKCKKRMISDDPNIFDRYAYNRLEEISGEAGEGVLFFDIREPENIVQMVEFFRDTHPEIKVLTVFVERECGEEFNNYADTNQGNYDYDIYIDNNRGLEELREASKSFVIIHVSKGEVNSEITIH
jgi:hypothetical protein